MRALQLLVFFSLVLSGCLLAGLQAARLDSNAQTSVSQSAKNSAPSFSSSNTKDQQRALAALRQLLVDSSQFEETFLKPVNILYIKYRIADLLWEHDPKLARRLFVEAFREAESDELNQGPGKMGLRLRQEILELLLPHDAGLAEELAASPTMHDDVPHMRALGD
ncbi:MAG: hypothetical protein ACREBD_25800, partial [Blastocatellia bacterium]